MRVYVLSVCEHLINSNCLATAHTRRFRLGNATTYEAPPEATRSDKESLKRIFDGMNGMKWNRKFGWQGQDKTMTSPEIRVFAASASLFQGVEHMKLGPNALITGLHLNGVGLEGPLPAAAANFEVSISVYVCVCVCVCPSLSLDFAYSILTPLLFLAMCTGVQEHGLLLEPSVR